MHGICLNFGLIMLVAGLNSCGSHQNTRTSDGSHQNSRTSEELSGAQSCLPSGTNLDSVFAVTQARSALAQADLALRVSSFRMIREEGVDLGLIISFVPGRQPPPAGGGGLVWLDIETACPTVLRRYE